ncbi:hypothetical protein ACFOYW_16605 [Gryllotalpicola reticulitermitis]|uniref:Uncharacterized protein n=1 Tax=Gryllotalpicola reticulitermitis TaxID=1184153 RepID=A0ABV8Q9E1_9MICO
MLVTHTPSGRRAEAGDAATAIFTPAGGTAITVHAYYETSWDQQVEPFIPTVAVRDILTAWTAVDPQHRVFTWPQTERSDDDAIIAYITRDGTIVLNTWAASNEDDSYSLTRLPSLLPDERFLLSIEVQP